MNAPAEPRAVMNVVHPGPVGDTVTRPDPLDRPRVVARVTWTDGTSEQVRGFARAWTPDHVLVHLATGHLVWMSPLDLRRPDALDL